MGKKILVNLISEIKECIEKRLQSGKSKFIIYPFGDVGIQVKHILSEVYGIYPEYILDNNLCKYNIDIKPLDFLNQINTREYILILASINPTIYNQLKQSVEEYFPKENIAEIRNIKTNHNYTIRGRYSYGPLCNHWLVKSVGNFCSFAVGCDVTENHPMSLISTHPFLYAGYDSIFGYSYDDYKNADWHLDGVTPKGHVEKLSRIEIGNDVWLGKNVTITNGSNIGNGVVAGAGTIITKDVPDYAIVVGAPAKIIRYRYTPEQINALNKIKWWNWTDDEIRERYKDFYLPIQDFIEKYI